MRRFLVALGMTAFSLSDSDVKQCLFNRSGDEQVSAVLRPKHSLRYGVVEEGKQAVVEAIHIQKDNGLGVEPEGLPREHLEELFKGAEASGQRDEGVGLLRHQGLARVHGIDQMQLADTVVGNFKVHKYLRNDADDAASGGERGLGDGAHQTDSRASIDEADIAGCERASEEFGCGDVCGVNAVSAGAVDGYVLNRHTSKILCDVVVEKRQPPIVEGCR